MIPRRSTDDGAEHRPASSDASENRQWTRRAVLASTGTAATLACGVGTVAGQTSESVPAPENLRALNPTTSANVPILWDAPADPCTGIVDHYVVTVDGSEHATIPAGVTRTSVWVEGTVTIGVTAVAADGTRSSTVQRTVENQVIADPGYTLQAEPETSTVGVGETVRAPLSLREGYVPSTNVENARITVAVNTPCVARITAAHGRATISTTTAGGQTTYPEIRPTVSEDGTTATFPPEIDIEAMGVTVEGQASGATLLTVTAQLPDGSPPRAVLTLPTRLDVEAASGPPAIVDGSPPTDPDDDGVYEDLNGNEEFDSDDVVTYFQHIDDPAIQNYPTYYDANGNGNADFDDVVSLFQRL